MTQHLLLKQLDAADNEEKVREDIALGHYNPNESALAQDWLKRKEEARASASAAKRHAREEETLSIARKALSNSSRANIIAISAITFSVITAAIIAWYTVKYVK